MPVQALIAKLSHQTIVLYIWVWCKIWFSPTLKYLNLKYLPVLSLYIWPRSQNWPTNPNSFWRFNSKMTETLHIWLLFFYLSSWFSKCKRVTTQWSANGLSRQYQYWTVHTITWCLSKCILILKLPKSPYLSIILEIHELYIIPSSNGREKVLSSWPRQNKFISFLPFVQT